MNFKKNQKKTPTLHELQEELDQVTLSRKELTRVYGGDATMGTTIAYIGLFGSLVGHAIVEWVDENLA